MPRLLQQLASDLMIGSDDKERTNKDANGTLWNDIYMTYAAFPRYPMDSSTILLYIYIYIYIYINMIHSLSSFNLRRLFAYFMYMNILFAKQW